MVGVIPNTVGIIPTLAGIVPTVVGIISKKVGMIPAEVSEVSSFAKHANFIETFLLTNTFAISSNFSGNNS